MQNLYLLQYNQYYNRLVKREESISAYQDYIVYSPTDENRLLNVSFNPDDGMDTEHVVNTPNADYDYVIVTNDLNEIESRWFVIQAKRNLAGQYTLTLHRDILADYYDEVCSATYFIQKATVPLTNKLIFNSENMAFNQIKKREIALKDETGCPWIVGYLADNAIETDTQLINTSTIKPSVYQPTPIALDTLQMYQRTGLYTIDPNNAEFRYICKSSNPAYRFIYGINTGGSTSFSQIQTTDLNVRYNLSTGTPLSTITQREIQEKLLNSYNNFSGKNLIGAKIGALVADYYTLSTGANLINSSILSTLKQMEGTIYSDGANSFKIRVIQGSSTGYFTPDNIGSTTLTRDMDQIFTDAGVGSINSNLGGVQCGAAITNYSIVIDTISTNYTAVTIQNSVAHLYDAPYYMFAIPFGAVNITGDKEFTTTNDTDVIKQITTAIAMHFGGERGAIYDVQLLPYCPARECVTEDGSIYLSDSIHKYSLITEDKTNVSCLIWCERSNFSTFINETIDTPTNAIDFKIENETSIWRLNSPNYNGAFEFKSTMNYGINGFEVNCTYQPYTPYIHVNPLFNSQGLFGGDFNDQRGLVCGGSYSMPLLTDAWRTYQIENSSYRDAFDRQIENMETTYNINRQQSIAAGGLGIASSAISGGASGAMIGSIGGPIGAGIGAAVGGITSAAVSGAGLLADLKYAGALQNEALDYAKDMFGYQLQNIKALPYTIGRVGAFNINNKLFPFLEYYTCSDEEKEALRNKLKYNGMTVMTIGTISDYQQSEPTYIAASLIRIESIADDYHTAASIASEIHKGVYI